MANTVTIRMTSQGVAQAATDLNNVKTSAVGAGSALKTSFGGLSGIDSSVGSLSGKMLDLSHNARLVNRETYGVGKFAAAIDTLAGTNLSGIVSGIQTVADVADPLQNIAGDVINKIKSLLPDATAAGAVVGEAEGEAESDAATGTGAIQGFLQKFGLMTGEKVTAATAAGEAEGAAEGSAAAEAMGGEEAVAGAGEAGAAVGGGFMAALAPVLAIGAAGVGTFFLPELLSQLTGNDAGSQISKAGSDMADKYASGYSAQVKATYASTVQDAYNKALAAAGPILTQQSYDTATQAAIAAGNGFLDTLPGAVGNVGKVSADTFMQQFAASTQAQVPVDTKAIGDAIVSRFQIEAQNSIGPKVGDAIVSRFQIAGQAGGDALAQAAGDALVNRFKTQGAVEAGEALAKSFLLGIDDEKTAADQSWTQFVNEMNHPLDGAAEIAKTKGELASKKLQEGLNSSSAVTRAQAQQEQTTLEGYLSDLERAYGVTGTDASGALKSGLSSDYPSIKTQAKDFISDLNGIFDTLKTQYGIKVAVAGSNKIAHLPPPHAAGGHMAAGELGLVGEQGPELFQPDVPGTVIPHGAASSSLGEKDIHVHVHLEGDAAGLFRVIDREQGRRLALAPASSYARG